MTTNHTCVDCSCDASCICGGAEIHNCACCCCCCCWADDCCRMICWSVCCGCTVVASCVCAAAVCWTCSCKPCSGCCCCCCCCCNWTLCDWTVAIWLTVCGWDWILHCNWWTTCVCWWDSCGVEHTNAWGDCGTTTDAGVLVEKSIGSSWSWACAAPAETNTLGLCCWSLPSNAFLRLRSRVSSSLWEPGVPGVFGGCIGCFVLKLMGTWGSYRYWGL